MYNDREYTISYPVYPDEGVDYLPALTDAVAEYAESNTENNRAVVLELLKRSFLSGEKLITPYENAKEKGKIGFLMKQVAEKVYSSVYFAGSFAQSGMVPGDGVSDCRRFSLFVQPGRRIRGSRWNSIELYTEIHTLLHYKGGDPNDFRVLPANN